VIFFFVFTDDVTNIQCDRQFLQYISRPLTTSIAVHHTYIEKEGFRWKQIIIFFVFILITETKLISLEIEENLAHIYVSGPNDMSL
jgi:hypothetical protein